MKTIKIGLNKKGVYFSTKLPSFSKLLKALDLPLNSKKTKPSTLLPFIICDQKLKNKPVVKSWLKTYPVYFVTGGEDLKALDAFPKHVDNVLKKIKNKKIAGFVSLGGGSVGDFTGFLASIYKRGVPLIHIPSTWLSAMDSAHGGKTALNVKQVKNVLGSYCFPKSVFIVKELLFSLSEKERTSAEGELLKMALIEGGPFYKKLIKLFCERKVLSNLNFWNFLPLAVFAKLKIVRKDPYDKKGIRRKLNFGHTIGHVLESYFKISHGEAVMLGICFSIRWSSQQFKVSNSFLKELSFLNQKYILLNNYLRKIPKKTLKLLLLQDKKRMDEGLLSFVFIKAPGQVFSREVSMHDILKVLNR